MIIIVKWVIKNTYMSNLKQLQLKSSTEIISVKSTSIQLFNLNSIDKCEGGKTDTGCLPSCPRK